MITTPRTCNELQAAVTTIKSSGTIIVRSELGGCVISLPVIPPHCELVVMLVPVTTVDPKTC